MKTKVAKVRALLAAGDEVGALRMVARFPRQGADKAVIERGWMAHTRPGFVREIGGDPAALFAAAVAAVRAKYGAAPAAGVTQDRVEWLRTLVGAFREARAALDAGGHPDPDPDATAEMLREVGRLADALDSGCGREESDIEPDSIDSPGTESIPF